MQAGTRPRLPGTFSTTQNTRSETVSHRSTSAGWRTAAGLILALVSGSACDQSATSLAPETLAEGEFPTSAQATLESATGPTGVYKASFGTLPELQGWTYGGDNGNAPPTVAAGVLAVNSTAGQQYWRMFLPVRSFRGRFAFEARLKIISSNYVPNIGTETREGYYFMVSDSSSSYTLGLSDAGFNVNSICIPNQPLTPYPLADGRFHDIHFRVFGGRATLKIDGTVVANNLTPDPFTSCPSVPGIVTFGAVAGTSRSSTELRDFAFRTW